MRSIDAIDEFVTEWTNQVSNTQTFRIQGRGGSDVRRNSSLFQVTLPCRRVII